MTKKEMKSRGWQELDVLLITGDAYFDHPSHGTALIGRVLEDAGYRVGIVAQPNWKSTDDFTQMGSPSLFVGITAGAVDSIVNNYTATGARRKVDVYSPGGKGGNRPDLATLVYANRAREAFPGVPVILGGVEASLRRFAYFDARSKKMRRSILVDSRADLLVYGNGEQQVLEIAGRLAEGRDLSGIKGTARLIRGEDSIREDALGLPSFDVIKKDPAALVRQALEVDRCSGPGFEHQMHQRYDEGVVLAEPRPRASSQDLDKISRLPFTRHAHPSYKEPIPALETVRWSVISHRGCPGGCSFCGLAAHQGRQVITRSSVSILEEVRTLAADPEFKGTITDIGGPTANAYTAVSKRPGACKDCRRTSCLFPKICRHLDTDHGPLIDLLTKASKIKGVKRVFLASGIRHDLALADPKFIECTAQRHTGGHLKVAPEHVDPSVLSRMRKPSIALFERFEQLFKEFSRAVDKEQYLVPYFIAGFPGCKPEQADSIGSWLGNRGQRLQQVQTFIPIAGTTAAAMFAAGLDEKGKPLFIPDAKEQKRQKEILISGAIRNNRPGQNRQKPQKRRTKKTKER